MFYLHSIPLTLVVTALFSSGSSILDKNGTPNPVFAQIQAMGVSNTTRLEAFLAEVCMVSPTTVRQRQEERVNKMTCRDNIGIKIDKRHIFILDKNSGDILSCDVHVERAERTDEEKLRGFQCSPEDIFAMSANALDHLEQPENQSRYKVQPVLPDPRRIKDSRFGEWYIIREYYYNTVPCRERYSRLTVFPGTTGLQVLHFINFPRVTREEEPQHPISKEEAVAAAKAWFNAPHFYAGRLDDDVIQKMQAVIALPNSCFGRGKSTPDDCRGTTAQYCWELPFSFKEASWSGPDFTGSEHTFYAFLWVSQRTSEVIGTCLRNY